MTDPTTKARCSTARRIPSDYFPSPFPNVQAAAAANGGAAPPDFSLIAKARGVERGFPTFIFDIFTQYAENGPDYIHSLLTGYGEEPPAGMEIAEGTYYNPYFIAGKSLAMPPPLSDGQVTYDDGIAADGRPIFKGRLRLPDVGSRAASRGSQEDGLPRPHLPGAVRRTGLPDQAQDLGRRSALSRYLPTRGNRRAPNGALFFSVAGRHN